MTSHFNTEEIVGKNDVFLRNDHWQSIHTVVETIRYNKKISWADFAQECSKERRMCKICYFKKNNHDTTFVLTNGILEGVNHYVKTELCIELVISREKERV